MKSLIAFIVSGRLQTTGHYITPPDRVTGGTDCCCCKQDSEVRSLSATHSLLPWMMVD